jgi:hypothetical protein
MDFDTQTPGGYRSTDRLKNPPGQASVVVKGYVKFFFRFTPMTSTTAEFLTPPVKDLTTIEKNRATRMNNTLKRNQRIRTKFNHLYNVDRKRYDDVIQTLCEDFSLSKAVVERIMKATD